jgi:UDP-N-acetylglucosamine--dolichyl-phosphate N-acetylglucosaminephosphotransferase
MVGEQEMWAEKLTFGALAFIITLMITPRLMKILEARNIVGIDIHKEDKPRIPEMGGLVILVAFLTSLGIAYLIYGDVRISIAMWGVFIVGVLGIWDGIKKLSAQQKVISLLLIGVILIPFLTPAFLGYRLGILYLLLIPFFFMCACNFTNMLAGFNGLEIGTGAIASFGIAILAYITHSEVSFLISVSMFGTLLAFLYFNKYPARVFPGDVGTLIIGASLFHSIIFGKFELTGAIVFIPYAVDAALKYSSVGIMTRESQIPTKVRDGKLYVPEESNLSLPRIFLRKRALTEKEVVHKVWLTEAVFCFLAVLVEVLLF